MQVALTKLDLAMAALPLRTETHLELLIHTEATATSGAISFGYWMQNAGWDPPTTPGSNPCPTRSNWKASPWSSNRPGKIGTGST